MIEINEEILDDIINTDYGAKLETYKSQILINQKLRQLVEKELEKIPRHLHFVDPMGMCGDCNKINVFQSLLDEAKK